MLGRAGWRSSGRSDLRRSVDEAWRALAAPGGDRVVREAACLDGLPPPGQRLLDRVVPVGRPLSTGVELHMRGEIKLGNRWMPFDAHQILRAGTGFVWKATVGGHLLRFVGADLCAPGMARMEFRWHGLDDSSRSACSDGTTPQNPRPMSPSVDR